MTALRHQLQDDGRVLVTVVGDHPASGRVTAAEAKRFAWGLLADLDPDALEDEAQYTLNTADKIARGLSLMPKLGRVLATLYVHEGAVRRSHLLKAIEADTSDTKVIDVYVCKIRKACGQGFIETFHGKGVRLSLEARAKVASILGVAA